MAVLLELDWLPLPPVALLELDWLPLLPVVVALLSVVVALLPVVPSLVVVVLVPDPPEPDVVPPAVVVLVPPEVPLLAGESSSEPQLGALSPTKTIIESRPPLAQNCQAQPPCKLPMTRCL